MTDYRHDDHAHQHTNPDAQTVTHLPGYWPPTPMPAGHRRSTMDVAPQLMNRVDERRTMAERVLEMVMRVVVIITCVIVVYTIVKGYLFLDRLGDALGQLNRG